MNGDLSMLKSELSALVNLDSDISISGWAVEFATDSSLEPGVRVTKCQLNRHHGVSNNGTRTPCLLIHEPELRLR